MPTILPRSVWTDQPSRATTKLDPRKVRYFVVHYPGAGPAQANRDPRASLRGWRDFHMGPQRGWRDIAYNYAVDLKGNIYTLRGWHADGGVKNMGGQCVSVLLIIGGTEPMTDAMKASVKWLAGQVDTWAGKKLARVGHGTLSSTDCPGVSARAWVKAGMPLPGTAPLPAPPVVNVAALAIDGSFGPKSWTALDYVNQTKYRARAGTRIHRLQRVLNLKAEHRGWKPSIKVDGKLGPKTYTLWGNLVGISGRLTTLTNQLATNTQRQLVNKLW